MNTITIRRRLIAPAVIALAAVLAFGGGTAVAAKATPLKGTFKLDKGAASGAKYKGSYFRMIFPGGASYFSNTDSTAKDKTYTLFTPGTDKGLKLGKYQAPPSPAFDTLGNALTTKIVKPLKFVGVKFSISTAAKDAQTGAKVPVPTLKVKGKKVTGDLRAWTAEWNKIYFNQGSPKPNGSFPAPTKAVTGTYNKKTKKLEIAWQSLIVGGPFNGFTGYWHLQGKLTK
jgi:hypothetical protein